MFPMLAALLVMAVPTRETAGAHALFGRREAVPARANGPVLEISGDLERDTLRLDPAFDVAPAEADGAVIQANAAPSNGAPPPLGIVRGYDAAGRVLFTLGLAEPGPFHAYIGGLDGAALTGLQRLELTSSAGTTQRTAGSIGQADIEVVAIDDKLVVLKWNGRAAPEVRVREGGKIVAIGNDSSTFSQLSFASSAAAVYVEISDGLHSLIDFEHIFGR